MRKSELPKWSIEIKDPVWGGSNFWGRDMKFLCAPRNFKKALQNFKSASWDALGALRNSEDALIFQFFRPKIFHDFLAVVMVDRKIFFSENFFYFSRDLVDRGF